MTAKEPVFTNTWIDPDDAPEWSEEQFAEADLYHGNMLVRRGRPRLETPKQKVNIRLSPDVIEAFRASGRGWQGRIDAALKSWIAQHGGKISPQG